MKADTIGIAARIVLVAEHDAMPRQLDLLREQRIDITVGTWTQRVGDSHGLRQYQLSHVNCESHLPHRLYPFKIREIGNHAVDIQAGFLGFLPGGVYAFVGNIDTRHVPPQAGKV